MPETAAIAQFERRLAELGCPAVKLHEKVRELAEHHDDLKQAALEDGLAEAEAEAQADERLGEPVTLAAHAAAALRQSSWWGRHRFIAFGLLPPVAIFLAVCGALALDFLFSRLYFPPQIFSVLADEPPDLKFLQVALIWTSYAAIGLTAMSFCVAANRSAAGLRCGLAACVGCAVFNFFVCLRIEPHTLAYGCNFPVSAPRDWMPVLLPALVGLAAIARRWLWLRQFTPLPRHVDASRQRPTAAGTTDREWLTPTSATVFLLLLVAAVGFRQFRADLSARQAHQEKLAAKIWPAERAAVLERLNHRGLAPGMSRAVPLNLTGVVDAALTDPLAGPGEADANSLSALPLGTHIFAGIPFRVDGRVQLLGRSLQAQNPKLPLCARHIPVGMWCDRIFLLHSATGLTPQSAGTKVAKLVLHYADGSQAAIPLLAGRDVQDWWGPIYETEAGALAPRATSAATELAWVGTNPEIQRVQPEWSLRLYRTILRNPHPEQQVVSADFASAGGEASPFLLGLTVEMIPQTALFAN